jgi:hypothetical protein
MSNLIPPLLSSSPPPIVGPLDEDDDDEFGDFRAAAESYDCDDFSLPSSPQKSPEKELKTDFSKVNLDINSNKSQKVTSTTEMPSQNYNGSIFSEETKKDFQDRRKSLDDNTENVQLSEIEVNCSDSQPPNIFDTHKSKAVYHVDPSDIIEDKILDAKVDDLDIASSNDEISKIPNYSDAIEDDFSELQSVVPSSINNCDEIQDNDINNVEIEPTKEVVEDQDDLNVNDNVLDAFSESVQEKINSDASSELNETNEIKSEDEYIEEINSEIIDKDNEKDKFDSSSKEINYDNLSESSVSLKVCETDPKFSDDEFGDFENHFGAEFEDKQASEDEFADFTNSFAPKEDAEDQEDDDFGDFESPEFGDFSQTCGHPDYMDINVKNAADKSGTILKEMFPGVEEEMDEFEYIDDTKANKIFDELKDITETNALIYQWSKSNSQKMFLKALNIDTRNILYGPAWSCSMPRFAANLGLTPLQPVKTEILTPIPVQNVSSPSNSSQKNSIDIPTAQFDWSGSGLINPLDSASTAPPGNVPEESSQQHVQNDILPTTSEKAESIPSLFEIETFEKSRKDQLSLEVDNKIELPKPLNGQSDFSPFQSPKLIPLRETHISTEMNDLSKPGWLQPTILTPDLPRKETVIDPVDDDEFDDFQMVLPEEKKEIAEHEVKSNQISLPDLSEFDTTSKVPPVNKISHNQEHIFGASLSSGPIDSSVQKQPNNVSEEEEFTDFHSSLPQPEIFKPLQPVPMEPLKPSVQYSAPVAQINWPDPGVTDEDIKNIELSYSRKVESKVEKVEKLKKSKENSLEDEEWSDFVSVTNSVKPNQGLPERTSTPDLPLSVLNLNHVQAPKQPIPVITPSGLVQTKLSSNLTRQSKSVVQTSVQPNMFRPPTSQFHPSIISNQYAANMFAGASQSSKASPSPADDDDDWSDFVSSQPPPQVNGYQQKPMQGRAPQANWANATTNIIMNPTHFESFQSYGPPQNKKVTSRNAIPSISAMPDLDFIAPKNRTSKK